MAQDKRAYNREYYQKNKWRWEEYYNKDNTPPAGHPKATALKAKQNANAKELVRNMYDTYQRQTANRKAAVTSAAESAGYLKPKPKKKKKSVAERAVRSTAKAATRTAKKAAKAAKKAASYIAKLFGGSSGTPKKKIDKYKYASKREKYKANEKREADQIKKFFNIK